MSWKFSFFSSANSIKSSVKATQRNIILGDGFHRLKGLWHSKQTAAWRWVCGYKLHLSWVMWCMREGLVRKVPGLFYLSDCQPRAAAWEWVTRRNGPSSSKVIPLDVYTQGLLMFAFFFFFKKMHFEANGSNRPSPRDLTSFSHIYKSTWNSPVELKGRGIIMGPITLLPEIQALLKYHCTAWGKGASI